MFYNPNVLGHADNYIPANPLVTPAHIVPEWYFLPFYAILRAIPDKLGGRATELDGAGVGQAARDGDDFLLRRLDLGELHRACATPCRP